MIWSWNSALSRWYNLGNQAIILSDRYSSHAMIWFAYRAPWIAHQKGTNEGVKIVNRGLRHGQFPGPIKKWVHQIVGPYEAHNCSTRATGLGLRSLRLIGGYASASIKEPLASTFQIYAIVILWHDHQIEKQQIKDESSLNLSTRLQYLESYNLVDDLGYETVKSDFDESRAPVRAHELRVQEVVGQGVLRTTTSEYSSILHQLKRGESFARCRIHDGWSWLQTSGWVGLNRGNNDS